MSFCRDADTRGAGYRQGMPTPAPPASASSSARAPGAALLIAAVLLLAANLRAPITGVAPLLDVLQDAFALTAAQAGLLTTLPILAFALLSPLAPGRARAWGLERTVLLALALVALGLALRASGWLAGLYLGTCLMGAGIALGNVLLPSLVKRDFPRRVAAVTSAYSISMGVAAALASASVVGLQRAAGWQWALAAPLVLVLPALWLWIRMPARAPAPLEPAQAAGAPITTPVWRSALAWQVSLFMGLNSLLYYVLVTWLPSMLTAGGLSASTAGQLHGVMQLATAAPGLVLAPLVARLADQRLPAAAMAALMGVSALGLWWAPGAALLWAFGFGFGSGGGILLALIFMGLRTGSPAQAAALSGMAQTLGYLLAAGGPAVAGQLRASTGSWAPVLAATLALSVLMALLGLQAGRSRMLDGAPGHSA